ncbi:MAG: hypothetical protein MHM6MM_009052 [Cercozoa sp. M6MM]
MTETTVVLPGDSFDIDELRGRADEKIRIGGNLVQDGPRHVRAFCGGVMHVTRTKGSVPRVRVEAVHRRYQPQQEDQVIGIVRGKAGQNYSVDIGASKLALLGVLEFEGATKRNRPNLNVGDTVYCRVVLSQRHVQPRLSCKSQHFKKEWVTGEALYSTLDGGVVFDVSPSLCRRLRLPDCELLETLASITAFELTVGVNGRVWVSAATPRHTVLLKQTLTAAEQGDDAAMQTLHRLVRKLGSAKSSQTSSETAEASSKQQQEHRMLCDSDSD